MLFAFFFFHSPQLTFIVLRSGLIMDCIQIMLFSDCQISEVIKYPLFFCGGIVSSVMIIVKIDSMELGSIVWHRFPQHMCWEKVPGPNLEGSVPQHFSQ